MLTLVLFPPNVTEVSVSANKYLLSQKQMHQMSKRRLMPGQTAKKRGIPNPLIFILFDPTLMWNHHKSISF